MAERFNQFDSGVITGVIRDKDGDPIPGSQLTVLNFTLRDIDTGTILNNRQTDDILPGSPVPVDEEGNLEVLLEREDNAIVTASKQVERHLALFEFEWSDGGGTETVEVWVRNLNLGGSPGAA